jgi:predicted O-methyltransferase YrrM
MAEKLWADVDRFITDRVIQPSAALDDALQANQAADLPAIDVSAPLGKLLRLLAESIGARRILEIGTLGGYSTIWMAQALPAEGRLISLEAEPKHAEVARSNVERAGLSHVVEIREGRASEALPRLDAENTGPFDLVFIDADKVSTVEYFNWALRLARRGSLIVVDNVVRNGAVIDADSEDESVQGVRRFYEVLAGSPGVLATALQTVGAKGYDGVAIVLVTADLPEAKMGRG